MAPANSRLPAVLALIALSPGPMAGRPVLHTSFHETDGDGLTARKAGLSCQWVGRRGGYKDMTVARQRVQTVSIDINSST
jgi:hypothetical protein